MLPSSSAAAAPNENVTAGSLNEDHVDDEEFRNTVSPSSKRKSRSKEDEESKVKDAIEAIKGGMSVRKASQVWDIPRTTLQHRKRFGFCEGTRRGPPTILTKEEEKLLCDWLIELSRRGIPIQKQYLLDSIQKILSQDPRETPFKDNRPGKGWFKAFLQRHSNIAERCAEPICRGRAKLTESCIRGWFSDAEAFFEEKNCKYIMENPKRQYNGDETGFQLDPRSGRVLASKKCDCILGGRWNQGAVNCSSNNQSGWASIAAGCSVSVQESDTKGNY